MIKVSMLSSILHKSNSFEEENLKFIQDIGGVLGEPIEEASLDDYDCDLKLIFIASGGSEGLFLKALPILKEPYYLLATGANNSLAASLEILTYLSSHNLKGEVLHGSIDYIAEIIKKINEEERVNEEEVRFGVIGKPSDWLIASIPDYNEIYKKYKIKLIDIDLGEVIDIYNQIKLKTVLRNSPFDLSELEKAERFGDALEVIADKYKLSGLTIRCFDLLDKIKMTGCLALARLNAKGIICACEGDIMALVSMYLVKRHFGKTSFQANPSVIDTKNKEVVFAHCTIPYDMCTSFKYDTHFESKIGVAIKGELACKRVGVFRMSANLKDYFFETGTIVENLNETNLCRTQIKIKFASDIEDLLKHPCGNHHIIFYLD